MQEAGLGQVVRSSMTVQSAKYITFDEVNSFPVHSDRYRGRSAWRSSHYYIAGPATPR